MAVVANRKVVDQEHLVDLGEEVDKAQILVYQEVQQIQTQIQIDKDILVAILVVIQIMDGVVPVAAEVLAVLVLLEMIPQEVQIHKLLVAVVESVSNYHQRIEIQILE